MRFFDEVKDGKCSETLVMMDMKDAQIIVEALEEYCKNNKRKIKAKKLLKDISDNWGIYPY